MEDFTRFNITTPITLVGMPGAGKTTTGKRLANRLGIAYFDSDKEVEKRVGCSVKEIFKYQGEAYFRQKEYEVIKELLCSKKPAIISSGSGAFCHPSTFHLIKENSVSIWINTDLNFIVNRVTYRDTRPEIDKENPRQTVEKLFEEREAYYKQADIYINPKNLSINELVERIVKTIEPTKILEHS